MWRHQGRCHHCGFACHWHNDPEKTAAAMREHGQLSHKIPEPQPTVDYHMLMQRQCDYCLGESVDTRTKCERDFCREHTGFIDGLCSCCI
jgi:hypothetical protein